MTSRIEHNNPTDLGSLNLTYHYEMLSDPRRVMPFYKALELCAKDRVSFESGTGSGILSLLAAQFGASQVFCTELDPEVAEFACKNIERSGRSNVTLFQRSTLEVGPDDLNGRKVDLVIAENLSTWQVTEPEIQVMNHITRHLATPDAIRLPTLMENCIELAHTQFEFYGLVQLRTHYFEFTGIPAAHLLSEPAEFNRFDFREINSERVDNTVTITATESGTVNCLRLTSPLQIFEQIRFDSSDSLMPPVIFPLQEDISVQAGDTIAVSISYGTCSSWEEFQVEARLV